MSLGLNGGGGVGATFESGSITATTDKYMTITFQSTPKIIMLSGNGTLNMSIKTAIVTPVGDITQCKSTSSNYSVEGEITGKTLKFRTLSAATIKYFALCQDD